MENKFSIDKNTGMLIQELRNGFLGREVTYFMFKENNLIATSLDKKTWKWASWIDKMKLEPVKPNFVKAETQIEPATSPE